MKKYLNIVEVPQRNGTVMYRARLVFPRDRDTNIKLPDKNFVAKTKALANKAREKYLSEHGKKHVVIHRDTLYGYLRDDFIPHKEKCTKLPNEHDDHLSWQRFLTMKNRLYRHIIYSDCALTDKRLQSLQRLPIEKFFLDLAPKVSAEIFNLVRQDLKCALERAYSHDKCDTDPKKLFASVKRMRVVVGERMLFSTKQISRIIYSKRYDAQARALIAIPSLMFRRPSEIFALQWSDIDWEQNKIAFDKAMRRGKNGFDVTPGSKTGAKGNRELPMPAVIADLLKQIHKKRMQERSSMTHYVFVDGKGNPFNKDSFEYAWRDLKKALGLPAAPTYYSLKHLGISDADANGESPTVISQFAGWTTLRMMETYRKPLPGELERSAATRGERMRKLANA